MGWLKEWLGAKSAPAQSYVPGGTAAWLMAGQEGGFARSYERQVEEVFRHNPVGQRSVRLVAGAVGGLSVDAFGDKADEAAALLSPALLDTIAVQLLLHGNAYVRLLDNGRGGPRELLPLRPERVSVATDATGWPSGYAYRVGGKAERIAKRDPLGRLRVAHLKMLDPVSDYYGCGCLDAAIGAATVHNRASRWNKALLDNAARPSGALVHEPGDGSTLSSEQFERLKNELSAQFEGSDNAGRPLLLDGGLKWQAMSLSPADMDFVALKEASARDVALAFGVPPVLVGLPGDATYANAREAGRALYRQTVLPMAAQMLAGIAELLSDWLGEVRFAVDQDQISELLEDRTKLWEGLSNASFLSDAEKRVMLGFEAEPGQ